VWLPYKITQVIHNMNIKDQVTPKNEPSWWMPTAPKLKKWSVYRYSKISSLPGWPWISWKPAEPAAKNGPMPNDRTSFNLISMKPSLHLFSSVDVIFQIPYHNLTIQTYNHVGMSKHVWTKNYKNRITLAQKPEVLNRLVELSLPFLNGMMQLRAWTKY
jgi:hypothetical protein